MFGDLYMDNIAIKYLKQSKILVLKETQEIANKLINMYKNNFAISFFIVCHNIIKKLLKIKV